jgi:PKD repeat protein
VHVYDSAGTYQVCLVTSSPTGCSDTFCSTVHISTTNNCNANFGFQINDSLVSFFDNSTGSNLNYHWSFGDSSFSTLKNPTHVYDNPGNYNVCLEVTDNQGCSDILCQTIYVGFQNCDAGFNYQATANTVHFQNTSQGTYNIISWDFGDGSGSHASNPVHTYASNGHYQVCLTVEDSNTACIDTYCDTVVVSGSGSQKYAIAGQIYAGGTVAYHAYAILYHDSAGALVPVDTQPVDSSYYYFAHVDSGTYYVVGALDSTSPHYSQYMPTYHDSANYWQNATAITVGPDYFSGHIYLQPSMPLQGNGYVSGNVTEGSGKTWGAGDPLPGVTVYLRNSQGVPAKHDQTAPQGTFAFENVPEGFYTLYVEIPGHECEPFAVTINTAADTVGNINFQVKDNRVITGLQPQPDAPLSSVEIYPNPFDEHLRIHLGSDLRGTVQLRIFDINGRLVQHRELRVPQQLQIPTGGWPEGLYFIEIQSQQMNRKVKKALKMR